MIEKGDPMRRALVLFTAAGVLLVAGCGSDDGSSSTSETEVPATTVAPTTTAAATTAAPTTTAGTTTTAEPALEGTLTVMAPGPFKGVLETAKADFEAAHAGVTVELNLGHVPTLITQLEGGVVADVLITPDAGSMGQAETKGLLSGATASFAKVPMALVVPAGNPAGVADVTALADPALKVAACAAELPCGKLAEMLATKAAITISADTLETGGSPGIVTKASTGEIDVGLVFSTDIAAGGDKVAKVAIADDVNVASDASIAALGAADDLDIAAAFIDYLMSEKGLALVTGKGFLAP